MPKGVVLVVYLLWVKKVHWTSGYLRRIVELGLWMFRWHHWLADDHILLQAEIFFIKRMEKSMLN